MSDEQIPGIGAGAVLAHRTEAASSEAVSFAYHHVKAAVGATGASAGVLLMLMADCYDAGRAAREPAPHVMVSKGGRGLAPELHGAPPLTEPASETASNILAMILFAAAVGLLGVAIYFTPGWGEIFGAWWVSTFEGGTNGVHIHPQ